MISKIAEYRIKGGMEAHIEAVVKEFVAAVAQAEPDTVYRAYQLEDKRRFLHYMSFADTDAEIRHQRAPYTQSFVAALYPYCELPPRFTAINNVAATDVS